MTFTRSPAGIANRVLFTGADFTVYVESDEGADPVIGLDCAFWRQVFSELYPQFSFSFSRLGGKHHVLAMAQKVISDSIPNVVCILDRDYDHCFGAILEDDRVFYTHGYGVENDMLCVNVAKGLIGSFLPHDADNPVHQQVLEANLLRTFASLKWPVIGDKIGKSRDFCLLNREQPQADFYSDNQTLPVKLRYKPLYQRMITIRKNSEKKKLKGILRRNRFDIPAHHYFEVIYQTIRRYISGFTKEKYSKKAMCTVAISFIRNNFLKICDAEIRDYFNSLGARDLERFRSV